MNPLSCGEVEELAPELALGTLPGDARSAVLAHLDGCGDCRHLVKELSDAGDALLFLAPPVEPPAGFAQRVTKGFRPARTRRWRLVAAVAGAALVVGVAAGFLPGFLSHRNHAMVAVARFVPAPGEPVSGQVFTRADQPSWVFMTVRDGGGSETYDCDLVLRNGSQVWLGSFKMANGSGSWGNEIPVKLSDVRAVELVDASGDTAAQASLTK